jgi:hypothetical protein
MRWIEMAEISRQDRWSRTRIIAIAVGVEDGVDGKAASKITRRHYRRARCDAGMTDKSLERVLPPCARRR